MAQRHWVGGTNTWDATAGTKWALTNGGAGGQTVPGTSDDVFFDSGSGVVTVTNNSSQDVLSLSFSGFTGTFSGSGAVQVRGNFTWGSGMTQSWTGNFTTITNACTLTSNGKTFSGNVTPSANLTLGDDFVSTGGLATGNAITISDGGFNLKCKYIDLGGSAVTIIGGATTWELTGNNGGIPITFGNSGAKTLTLNAAHVFKFTDTSNTANTYNFNLGNAYPSYTFSSLWFARGASTGSNTISGKLTFAGFKDTGTVAHSLLFDWSLLGASYTLTNALQWVVTGSAGNLITLGTGLGGGTNPHNLICASGIVSSDFLSISESTANGGASFYAGANSTNGGSNSGWIFTAPPVLATAGFLFNMI